MSTSADVAERQLRQACAALERAIQTGSDARAEQWLAACPAVAGEPDLAVELIYCEYVSRESVGPAPAPIEYYGRFPQYAERLRRLFGVDELLRHEGDASSLAARHGSTRPGGPPANSTATPPRRVGAFTLLEKLGGGGMGVVYRARQDRPARDVALKLLRAGADAGAEELVRFHREADAAARLHHPNIAAVYEVGNADGQPYLAMEYVAGGDLRRTLAGRPLEPMAAARLTATLARAVHHAHERGVVHRDLKPANVLVAGPGVELPKITDFGLAALLNDTTGGLTRSGQLIGTLAYLAPELAAGTAQPAALPLADVYSLGAILYECMTGRPPFVAATDATTLAMVLHDEPVAPRRLIPGVPRDLETVALKCLVKNPARRYASAQGLADDLDNCIHHRPIAARPTGAVERLVKWGRRRPAAAAVAAATVVGLALLAAVIAIYTAHLRATLDQVDEQRGRAETALAAESRRRSQARTALDRLTDQLIAGVQGGAVRPEDQLKQLSETLDAYRDFAADAGPDATSQLSVVAALRQSARIHHLANRPADATRALDAATSLAEKLAADGDPAAVEAWAVSLFERARHHGNLGRHAEAVVDALKSADLERALPSRDAPAGRYRLGRVLIAAVVSGRRAGQADTADAAEREALSTFESLVRQFPNEEQYRMGLAGCLQNRAAAVERANNLTEALDLYRRAAATRSPSGELPAGMDDRVTQADCFQAIGRTCEALNRPADAVTAYLQAALAWDLVVTERRNIVRFARGLAKSLQQLAQYPELTGKGRDVEPVYARMRQRFQLMERASVHPEVVAVLAECTVAEARRLFAANRAADALAQYDAAAFALAEALAAEPRHTRVRYWLETVRTGQARTLYHLRRYDDAVAAWDGLLTLDPMAKDGVRLERAKALARVGRAEEAVATCASASPDDAAFHLTRAAVYALAAAADPQARSERQQAAIELLEKARAAGKLDSAGIQRYLRTNEDWAAVRHRPEFTQLLARLKPPGEPSSDR